MQATDITGEAVRDALSAIRFGKPLGDLPLMNLDMVTARVRQDGVPDHQQHREWVLSQLIDEAVWANLNYMRGPDRAIARDELSPESELAALLADFAPGNIDLEAWSMLYFRYLGHSRLEIQVVAGQLGVSHKTLTRRLARGYELAGQALRDQERSADQSLKEQHNIPHAVTRFTGREREIGEVRALLGEHRLVTLAGPGGIGKSRLATELGRALSRDYTHGVWLIELAPLEKGTPIVSAVASTLHVKEEPQRELVDTLLSFIGRKHMLLLLDNCEHVVESCSDLVRTLLGGCRSLQIMAASRELLGVAGEAVYRVPPLDLPREMHAAAAGGLVLPDAMRLFADRAALAKPGFVISGDTTGTVASVCRLLDGLPLAIELACPMLRVLSLSELETRLATRLPTLSDAERLGRPQHRSMQAAIEWSHELLTEQERLMFRRLAVFRGGCTLDAAETVCSGDGIDEGNVLELLRQLESKSLIAAVHDVAEPRFHMLETIRQYARDRLVDEGEETAGRDRHMVHFLRLAERAGHELSGPDRGTWQPRLVRDYENVRRAFLWSCEREQVNEALSAAAEMCAWWEQQGQLREGRMLLDRLLATVASTEQTADRAAVLRAVSELARRQGEHADARQAAEDALEDSRSIGDKLGVAHASIKLGLVESAEGSRDTARSLFDESLSIYLSLGREADVARTHTKLGVLAARQGDYDLARQYLQSGLEVLRETGNDLVASPALMALGVVAQYQSDFATARQMFEETLAVNRRLDDKYGMTVALHNLGVTASAMGDREEARRLWEESLGLTREMGDVPGSIDALLHLGGVASDQGDLDNAQSLIEESLALARDIGHATPIPTALNNLGDIAIRRGEDDAARNLLEEGLTAARGIGGKRTTVTLHSNLGFLAARRGDDAAAHEHIATCLSLAMELADQRAIASALDTCARVEMVRERPERASRLIGAAEALRDAVGAVRTPANTEELGAVASQARTTLGPAAYDAAHDQGRALTLDEAVAYALGEVTWDELADEAAARIEAAGEGEEGEAQEASPE